jgi:hypothetical protein
VENVTFAGEVVMAEVRPHKGPKDVPAVVISRRGIRDIGPQILRDISVGGIASLISGTLVLGLGGRLVMYFSRLLHPEAIGRLTENGNEVGVFTVEGTMALVLFGGVASGLIAAPVWVMMKPWIPVRWTVVGLGAVAIGGFHLVSSDNRDFDILGGPALDIVLLLALVFAFGAVLSVLDRLLEGRLPQADRGGPVIAYGLVTAVGLIFVPLGLLLQFMPGFDERAFAPIWTGVFVCATALVTIWCWVDRIRGKTEPSLVQRRLGGGLAAAAALAGLSHLILEINRIL